jgi:L-fuculose-phosphate aldolase
MMPAAMPEPAQVRDAIVHVMQRLDTLGLNRGSSGNCSVREHEPQESFLITPSGVPAEKLDAAMIVRMGLDARILEGQRPSSEWRLHRDIYRHRSEAGAVIHTHSPFATTMACLNRDIPAFHYMIAIVGGDSIRCAPYAVFGSQELSDATLAALEGRLACLLGQHGMVAIGRNLDHAMRVTIEVESLCEQYWRALQIGVPAILSTSQMAEVLERFTHYGS